jgi:hypothetical protein
MNGFLVLLRCGMDDLPLGLFATHTAAWNFAKGIVPTSEEIAVTERVLSLDVSDLHAVSVMSFDNGVPVKCEFVHGFKEAAA